VAGRVEEDPGVLLRLQLSQRRVQRNGVLDRDVEVTHLRWANWALPKAYRNSGAGASNVMSTPMCVM
jgi:hypothetical protein